MIIYLCISSFHDYKISGCLDRKEDDRGLETPENTLIKFQTFQNAFVMGEWILKFFFYIKISSYIEFQEENGRSKSNYRGQNHFCLVKREVGATGAPVPHLSKGLVVYS